MKNLLAIILLCFVAAATKSQTYGNEWIRYNQQYLKFPLFKEGIYRIDYTTLSNHYASTPEGIGTEFTIANDPTPTTGRSGAQRPKASERNSLQARSPSGASCAVLNARRHRNGIHWAFR